MPQILISIIISVGVSFISKALFGKSSQPVAGLDPPVPRDNQEVARVASDKRTMIFGEARIAGPLLLFSTSGTDNEFLHLVVPHADHPCDAITEFFLNDESLIDETIDVDGADLVTNGAFATDTDWTKGTGWTISGGTATHGTGSASDIEQSVVITEGKKYLVEYEISGRTAGTITAKVGGTAGAARSINTPVVETIVAGSGGAPELEFTASSTFDGSIDKVSVKEVGAGTNLVTTGRFANHARVVAHLGAYNQAAASNLVTEVSEWTSNHKGGGVTYTEARLKFSQDVWPRGFDNLAAVVRGALLYDPRDTGATITVSTAADPAVFTTAAAHGLAVDELVWIKDHITAVPAVDKSYQVNTVPAPTTFTLRDENGNVVALSTAGSAGTVTPVKWSDNWALCVRHIITHVVGYDADNDEIDDTVLIAAANVSDEQVSLTVETANFTVVLAGDTLITAAKPWKMGDGMGLTTTGTLPAPLALATTYFLIRETTTKFKLATTLANARARVAIDITDTGSGTHTLRRNSQLRYAVNGIVDTGVGPQEIMEDLMSAGAGVVTWDGFTFKVYAGAATTFTGTIDEGDLRDQDMVVDPRLQIADSFNATRGQFFDREKFWGLVDAAPITNATYEAEDGNQRIFADFKFPFTTDGFAVQRLLKIALERNRQGVSIPFPAKPQKYKTQVWDVENVTLDHLGFVAKQFRVMKVTEQEDGGYDIELREEPDAVWDWNLGDETSIDLAPNSTLPDPFTVAPPTTMALTTDSFVTDTGAQIDRIVVSWVAPADQFVQSGGDIEIQFKKTVDANYEPAFFVKGAEVKAFIAPVEDGVRYDVRIRSVNDLGVKGAFVNIFSFEVGGASAGATVLKDYGSIADAATVFASRGGIGATADKFFDYETIT